MADNPGRNSTDVDRDQHNAVGCYAKQNQSNDNRKEPRMISCKQTTGVLQTLVLYPMYSDKKPNETDKAEFLIISTAKKAVSDEADAGNATKSHCKGPP